MVNVNLNHGYIYSLEVDGHAGGEHGKDIVCSAISALVQNILLGLNNLNVNWNYNSSDGYVIINVVKDNSEDLNKAMFLIETTLESMKKISKTYPQRLNMSDRRERENEQVV